MSFLPPMRPLRLSLDLDRRIDQAFTELIHEPWGGQFGADVWQPAIDVYETADAYLIEVDIPGVPPESVEVRVDGRRLMIRGTRQTVTWSQSQGGKNVHLERQQGHFCRSLELDRAVDIERLETQFDHGTLRARLPKKTLEPKQ